MRYVVSEVRALVQFLGLAVELGFRFRLSRERDVLGAELVHARFSVRVVCIAGGGVSLKRYGNGVVEAGHAPDASAAAVAIERMAQDKPWQ